MRTPAGYLFSGDSMKYTKPSLTIDDQIDLLISRGMEIPDRSRAFRYLSHISYFRLRGDGFDEKVLQSFMHHLTFIRNVTAHHGRLWNRRMTITMKLPRNPRKLAAMFNFKSVRKIGNTVIMLGYLLKLISPGSSWPARMRQLIQQSPGIQPAAMGFEVSWEELPLWKQ